jgi:hypothetical protein
VPAKPPISTERERSSSSNSSSGSNSSDDGDDAQSRAQDFTYGLQARLSRILRQHQEASLVHELEMTDTDTGDPLLRQKQSAGKRALAQLRSQRAPGAMSWLSVPLGETAMSTAAAATMLLVNLFVDGWRISGDACPWKCSNDAPTCTHAISCCAQHIRGHNATHTGQKRCLQRLLRSHHVSAVRNEDASIFKRPGLRADTVIDPGCLHFAGDTYKGKGVVLDTTVRAPTASKYLAGKSNAATTDGHTADVGEKEKIVHHDGALSSSWVFVPFVQESYGRLGTQASRFVKDLAMHSALCAGGRGAQIKRRAAANKKKIVSALSRSLALELAERVIAYVRGAAMLGCAARPVSALLGLGPA